MIKAMAPAKYDPSNPEHVARLAAKVRAEAGTGPTEADFIAAGMGPSYGMGGSYERAQH